MKATICEGKVFHLGECKWVAQVVNLTMLAACGKLQAQTFTTWVNSESFWFLKPHFLRSTAESFWGLCCGSLQRLHSSKKTGGIKQRNSLSYFRLLCKPIQFACSAHIGTQSPGGKKRNINFLHCVFSPCRFESVGVQEVSIFLFPPSSFPSLFKQLKTHQLNEEIIILAIIM